MENDVGSRGSQQQPSYYVDDKGYALSGRIMLSSIVILFFVVILMVCFHLYARWYLVQERRRQVRRTHFVFYFDTTTSSSSTARSRGLDASVLGSLPVFVYSSNTRASESLDCAVCLSEFEENESGRVLPKCNHTFHIDCIDMWFHSHSTCPLCRSPVELVTDEPEDPISVVRVTVESSRSENESTGGDSQPGSSIVSSFKRMLSREKKESSAASGNDVDTERGREETQR